MMLSLIKKETLAKMRLTGDVVSRGFARFTRWFNLFLASNQLEAFRGLPVIGLFLTLASLSIRSLQKVREKEVARWIKALYVLALLSAASVVVVNFALAGIFSFVFLSFAISLSRFIVDFIDFGISQSQYQNLHRHFQIEEIAFNANLEMVQSLKEKRDELLCQLILVEAFKETSNEPTKVTFLITNLTNKIDNYNKRLKSLQLPFLEKKDALLKAKTRRDTCFKMMGFSFACTTLIALPLLLFVVNPAVALAVFCAFEFVECLAISNIGYRLYQSYQAKKSVEENYDDLEKENALSLKTSTLKAYRHLNIKSGNLPNKETVSRIVKEAKNQNKVTQKSPPAQKDWFPFFSHKKPATHTEHFYSLSHSPKSS